MTINEKYLSLGGSAGFLGAPTIPESTTPDGTGRFRHYEHGSIYWSPQSDAHEVHGLIKNKWGDLGWESGFLRYPVTDELSTTDGRGRYNFFQHGMIHWTPEGGATAVPKSVHHLTLVKERSKPDIFLIFGGSKLWISSKQEFDAVGFDFGKVQVVPDGALDTYRRQHFAAPALIKPSHVFFDCGNDFDDLAGRWHFNCQSSANLIRKDVVVAGWLENSPYVNNKENGSDLAHGVEDIHYNLTLDPDFIDRMYGPGGLSFALDNTTYKGNPFVLDNPLVLRDIAVDGSSRGVTYNSFLLPNSGGLHGELNVWHEANTGGVFTRHYVGRGSAPGGWRRISFSNDANAWFPFDIMNPDEGPRPLHPGDYVLMKGALWQDRPDHTPNAPVSPWDRGATRGHAGWTEMHPVDWIVRVDEPKFANRKTVGRVSELAEENSSKLIHLEIPPGFTNTPPTRRYAVGEIQEMIDGRFTEMSTLSDYSVSNQKTHVVVEGTVKGTPTSQGRLVASYIVSWRETDIHDEVWVDDAMPQGATGAGDSEGWNWVVSNPAPFSGTQAHQSNNVMGMHQHFFFGATKQLSIEAGDTLLFACVYLDPIAVPYQVMLQWNDGSWEHRAYWGANLIDWGTDGTTSRRHMGPISIVGQWVRLEVPANLVGLEGRTINGMAFTLFGGRATWDYSGKINTPKVPAPRTLALSVTPTPVPVNRLVTVTVHATDVSTGDNVAGQVKINGVVVANTNTPFSHNFLVSSKLVDIGPPRVFELIHPKGSVTAPGYPETPIDFGFP